MLVQDEVLFPDASIINQTRPSSFSSFSNGVSTISDGIESGSKKRKRDGNTLQDLLTESFTVKPYPSTGLAKPRCLQPLLLLPRSQLPLSHIDTLSSSNVLPQSRHYETHVRILELEERMGSQPMLVIARLDDGRTLYAVEREDRGLYILCRLGSWVNLHQLRAVAAASIKEPSKSSETGFTGGELLQASNVPLTTSEPSKFSGKKRLAIEAIQSMVKRPSSGIISNSPLQIPTEPDSTQVTEQLVFTQSSRSQQRLDADVISKQPTAAEISNNVRTQYLDALYLSKASLAYFTKGPLSRARAAFHLDYDSTLDMKDHVKFLESLIMPTNLIDKKYRDGLPSSISLLDIRDPSADEGVLSKTKKRKSTKRVKLGKNGLYPEEDVLIGHWWAAFNEEADSGGPNDSKEDLIKARIAQLRIRETQLQIIIILETLALQPLASVTEEVGEGLPGILGKDCASRDEKSRLSKSRCPDQLTSLIDVHIDRLCIWQSIALESVQAPTGDTDKVTEHATNNVDNVLRDFCIEVIAPFFSSRLPDQCVIINRKLGGPIAFPPPKPKLSKSASFSGKTAKPGAATKRPVPVKPRRSLKRVLTDERDRRSMSTGPNRAISLMRSATMPAIPGLKREASEIPSLASIPTQGSQFFTANRGGVLNSKRFSQREIDLSSLATEPDSKVKKQAQIEAELKDAIAALKKPNRELAGRALAETAEKRSVPLSHPRKSKKPIRNPLFQDVQISATPKISRQMDHLAKKQVGPSPVAGGIRSGVVSSSSAPRVPQSSKPSHENSLRRNPLASAIQATPTRRSTISSQPYIESPYLSRQEFDGVVASSPLHIRRSSACLFSQESSEFRSMGSYTSGNGFTNDKLETPIKTIETLVGHVHPAMSSIGNDKENTEGKLYGKDKFKRGVIKAHDDSIYKSLGWDADETEDIG